MTKPPDQPRDAMDVSTYPNGIQRTNALADAMKKVSDLTRDTGIADVSKQISALQMPQIGALKSISQQLDALRFNTAVGNTSRQIEALRMPHIDALKSISQQVEALRLPQMSAVADLSKQIEAVRIPTLSATNFGGEPDKTPSAGAPKARRRVGSVSDLGVFARERRQIMGLTQQELADAAGTGRRFISEMESGKSTLEIGKVIHVCRYLGIDLSAAAR